MGEVLSDVTTRALPDGGNAPHTSGSKLGLDGGRKIHMRTGISRFDEFFAELACNFFAYLKAASSDTGSHHGFDVGKT